MLSFDANNLKQQKQSSKLNNRLSLESLDQPMFNKYNNTPQPTQINVNQDFKNSLQKYQKDSFKIDKSRETPPIRNIDLLNTEQKQNDSANL